MKSIFIASVTWCACMFLFSSCNQSGSTRSNEEETYIQNLLSARLTQDSLFRISKESPFYRYKNFTKLNYFKPDFDLRIRVKANTQSNPEIVQFETNTERKPVYMKKYFFVFNLSGTQDTLWGFVNNEAPQRVFVPFKDLSNGNTTYGGGRYMDIEITPAQDSVWLDFNTAYNPYCHYDTGYSCPVVPFENRLHIAIEAGEKLYH